MGCLRRDFDSPGRTRFCTCCFAKTGRAEARPSAMKTSSGILRGRDSFRYFDCQLEGSSGMRTRDFWRAAGQRTLDKGSELLPQRLFFFNRDRVARNPSVDPAVNFAALSLII